MRRRKAVGVVFAYEGLQPTSEASDKKLTPWTGEEKDTPSRSWATRVHQGRKLSTEGTRRPETGRPGNPIDPGGKAGAASFGTSRQVRETKGTISGPGNYARGTLEEMGLTETPRVVAGDCRLVWKRSSHTRQRPNFQD